MKKRMGKYGGAEYADAPLGDLLIIEDDLPPPDQLDFTEEKTRVTINLNEACVQFFKREAKRHRTPYQKIIRSVLDGYVRNATARAAQGSANVSAKKAVDKAKSSKGVEV
jgi:hypothetical protein